MVNDSSLHRSGQTGFDLETQKGIMHALASVRASDLSSAHKNELRDLIFLYSHSGKDPSTQIIVEQKLSAYAVQPLKVTPPPPPVRVYPFGTSRPAPTFPVVTPAQLHPHMPASHTETELTPPPPSVSDAVEPVQSFAPHFDDAPMEVPETSSVESELSAPLQAVAVEVEPVMPAQSSVAQGAAVTHSSSSDQYVARISEIKASVNERVGNPVNLVDINNQVGREYMSALLEAMKSLHSGASPASAMARLEAAYTAVESILQPASPMANQIEIAPAVVLEHVPVDTPVVQPVIEESVLDQGSDPVMVADVTTTPASVPEADQVEYPLAETQPQSSVPDVESSVQAEPPEVARVLASAWGTQTDTVPVPTIPKASSLAESATQPRRVDELKDAAALDTSSVSGDPLYTNAIDAGLDQLLSEWILFKKSGLFGTGPKGRQHPLFLKLAGLQIPLVLAGRFEGATQDIKQSITDYMNGWRYEQGLIYQPGETFEHYLRRVIKHILDLQNKHSEQ